MEIIQTSFNISADGINTIEKNLPNLKVDIRVSSDESLLCLDARFKNLGNNLNDQVVFGLGQSVLENIITTGDNKTISISWNYDFSSSTLEMSFKEQYDI